MKVLMFGWEFPPHNSGGLGVACQGLTHALSQEGISVTFVLPKKVSVHATDMNIVFADQRDYDAYRDISLAYTSPQEYQILHEKYPHQFFTQSLFDEVFRYASLARSVAASHEFDVIHAHDWLSLKAGIVAKEISGKPLVFHIHATEFDRTGGRGVNPQVYDIEKEGMERSDSIIAVSNFTKDIIVRHYGISQERVQVVHNGIDMAFYNALPLHKSLAALKRKGNKIVLFVGRITLQKGPDYFLRAASMVSRYIPKTIFVVAGAGDMEKQMIEESVRLGIGDKMIFAGFLRGKELNSIYQAADVLVMPSVSEPFGITALESLANETPVVISRQSGASEVLSHVLKVDFWDTDDMANKIIAVLKNPPLSSSLQQNGKRDVARFTWRDAAKKCITVYQQLQHQPALLSLHS